MKTITIPPKPLNSLCRILYYGRAVYHYNKSLSPDSKNTQFDDPYHSIVIFYCDRNGNEKSF